MKAASVAARPTHASHVERLEEVLEDFANTGRCYHLAYQRRRRERDARMLVCDKIMGIDFGG
jgi:hypothetical protein